MTRRIVLTLLHRVFVYLLPRAFRLRFGGEIRTAFARGLAARPALFAQLRYATAALVDLSRTAAAEWWRLRPEWPRLGEGLGLDVRDAWRATIREPGVATAVVVTLALGVGANAAIFRLADAVLLRPLPIAAPDEVVSLFQPPATASESSYYGLDAGLSYSAFRALEAGTSSLAGVAGFIDREVGLHDGQGARQLTAGAVSGGYFQVLGVRPVAGRLIEPRDDIRGGAARVAVLSDALWARDYGRSPDALGRTLTIGGTAFTIVGVTPRAFRGTRLSSRPELWVPLTTITDLRAGGIWSGPLGARMLGDHPLGWVMTIGRLRNGVTLAQAEQDLRLRLGSQADRTLHVRPVVEASTIGDRDNLTRFVTMLWSVVALTLLVACLNAANLLHVRSSGRIHQLALRAALGARRWRLIRQLVVEHLGLAALAGAGAACVAILALQVLAAFTLPGHIAISDLGLGFALDARTAVGVAVLALVATLAAGVGPALRASSLTSTSVLRAHGTAQRRGPRRTLIAGQVAATVILLVGAALFVRSLRTGLHADLGFSADSLSAVSVDLFRYGYNARRAEPYYDDVVRRVSALPGVRAVALTTHVPLSPLGRLEFDAPGGRLPDGGIIAAGIAAVSASYFDVMGIPVVQGRTFGPGDGRGAPLAAVISDSAARELFGPGVAVIGREIRVFGARPLTVVGVVRNVKGASVRDVDVPMVYQHFAQETATGGVSVIASSTNPALTLPALGDALRAVDPSVALYDARLLSDQVARALSTQRFGSLLLGLFAVIALTVAGVGIAGVVAYTTHERTVELGVRRALGASGGHLMRVVAGGAGTGAVAGLCLGLVAAALASRLLERFLFGVERLDWWSYVAATLIISVGAVVALVMPARRALRTDPLVAMRQS